MSTTLDQRRKELRDQFIEARGFWSPIWEGLLDQDPEFFASYLAFSAVAWRQGPLEPKVKEFVYIAVDAAATHLFVPGIRQHIRQALVHGATAQEIMEVIELTSTLGIHAANIGVPILVEELQATGQEIDRSLSARQEEIKADFEAKRGYWNAFWDGLLDLDPDFFEAYLEFSAHPWVHGVIPDKVKELLAIAWDASTTHMYEPGLRQHMANALGHGATPAEIMETLELAATLGIQSYEVALPILDEER
jgi:alkylhydroperoxidase/carboxymuconolactone decarboxylase family protein YurZ